MKTIFTVGAVVLATCLLSGCINEQKVNQLASNVQNIKTAKNSPRLEQDMKSITPTKSMLPKSESKTERQIAS